MKSHSFVLINNNFGNPVDTLSSETSVNDIVCILKNLNAIKASEGPFSVWLYEENDGFISSYEIKNLYNESSIKEDLNKNIKKRNEKLIEFGIEKITESQKSGSPFLNIKA